MCRLKSFIKTKKYVYPENVSRCDSAMSTCTIPTRTSDASSIRPKDFLYRPDVAYGGHRTGPLTCATSDGMPSVDSMVRGMDVCPTYPSRRCHNRASSLAGKRNILHNVMVVVVLRGGAFNGSKAIMYASSLHPNFITVF